MWVPEERLKLWARWAAHMVVNKQVLELREGTDYNLLQNLASGKVYDPFCQVTALKI